MGGALTESELLEAINRIGELQYRNHKIKDQSTVTSGTFIETGTYKGHSSRLASKYFDRVKTIEIFEPLYLEAKKWGDDEKIQNIDYYLGDTLAVLPKIVQEQVKPAFYFIDAHISGMDSSWNGTVTVPLMNELEIVLKNNTRKSAFIICFDDLRLFNLPPDWTGIHCQSIIDKIEAFNFKVVDNYVKNDRFWCFIESSTELSNR